MRNVFVVSSPSKNYQNIEIILAKRATFFIEKKKKKNLVCMATSYRDAKSHTKPTICQHPSFISISKNHRESKVKKKKINTIPGNYLSARLHTPDNSPVGTIALKRASPTTVSRNALASDTSHRPQHYLQQSSHGATANWCPPTSPTAFPQGDWAKAPSLQRDAR
jgi:hypothetical protein